MMIFPVLTEKGADNCELHNQYTFDTPVQITKVDMKRFVETHFGVSVQSITSQRRPINGKCSSYRRRKIVKRFIVRTKNTSQGVTNQRLRLFALDEESQNSVLTQTKDLKNV